MVIVCHVMLGIVIKQGIHPIIYLFQIDWGKIICLTRCCSVCSLTSFTSYLCCSLVSNVCKHAIRLIQHLHGWNLLTNTFLNLGICINSAANLESNHNTVSEELTMQAFMDLHHRKWHEPGNFNQCIESCCAITLSSTQEHWIMPICIASKHLSLSM